MKLLLSGDLHIGRASTRLPEAVPLEQRRAARAWEDLVDLAMQERADAVCLSGDIADQANKFWEAIGPLERGVQRLAEAGIAVYVVAGNHDHDVLANLADNLPGEQFRLIGRGGQWERVAVEIDGRAALYIDGWSFPQEHVAVSPLESYTLALDADAPILGVVHGDLNASASRYAPLDMAHLQRLPPQGWLLGHIHAPALTDDAGTAWVLYPGSPQALDPGETAAHGVWIVEVERGRLGVPRFRPLSPVRYEPLAVELDEQVQSAEDLRTRLLGAVRDRARAVVAESGGALRCLSLRVHVGGRSPLARHASELLNELKEQFDDYRVEDVLIAIESVECSVQPAIDLAKVAEDRSALGDVAQLLLELDKEQPAEEVARLIRQAKRSIRTTRDAPHYADLPDDPPVTDALARQYLRTQAHALLADLYEQVTE